jgi:hypothetical protein
MQGIGSWWLPRRPTNPELSDIPEFKTQNFETQRHRAHRENKSILLCDLCDSVFPFVFLP